MFTISHTDLRCVHSCPVSQARKLRIRHFTLKANNTTFVLSYHQSCHTSDADRGSVSMTPSDIRTVIQYNKYSSSFSIEFLIEITVNWNRLFFQRFRFSRLNESGLKESSGNTIQMMVRSVTHNTHYSNVRFPFLMISTRLGGACQEKGVLGDRKGAEYLFLSGKVLEFGFS